MCSKKYGVSGVQVRPYLVWPNLGNTIDVYCLGMAVPGVAVPVSRYYISTAIPELLYQIYMVVPTPLVLH